VENVLYRFIAAALTILAVSVWPAGAGSQEAETESLFAGIELGMTATTDRKCSPDEYYLLGEPIFLTVHIASHSSTPIQFTFSPMLEGDLRVEYRTPSSLWREAKNPVLTPYVGGAAEEILPFQTVHHTVKLLYDRTEKPLLSYSDEDGVERVFTWPYLYFDQQSYFRLKVQTLGTVNGVVRAPMDQLIEIHVKTPEADSAEDKILRKMVARKSRLADLQRTSSSKENMPFFEETVREYPESRYAPHFIHVLARSYDPSTVEGFKKAAEGFQRIIDDYPDYPARQAAMWELAKIYSVFQKNDEAYQMMQQLLVENPELRGESESDDLLKLYAGPGMPYDSDFWMLGKQDEKPQ